MIYHTYLKGGNCLTIYCVARSITNATLPTRELLKLGAFTDSVYIWGVQKDCGPSLRDNIIEILPTKTSPMSKVSSSWLVILALALSLARG